MWRTISALRNQRVDEQLRSNFPDARLKASIHPSLRARSIGRPMSPMSCNACCVTEIPRWVQAAPPVRLESRGDRRSEASP